MAMCGCLATNESKVFLLLKIWRERKEGEEEEESEIKLAASVLMQDPNTQMIKKNTDYNRITQNVCTFLG